MKKLLSVIVALALMVLTAVPALAFGHCGGTYGNGAYGAAAASRYAVCEVEDCELTGLHTHDRVTYTSHYYGDGHDYHEYCGISGCALTGYHEHDGEYCFGRAAVAGQGYYRYGTRCR